MKSSLLFIAILSLLFISCEETDTQSPTVTITSPQDGSTVSEVVEITCIATDDDAIDHVQLWVDGVSLGVIDKTEPFSLPCSTNSYVDGSVHTFTVRAQDKSENVTDSSPISLTIDNTNSWPDSVNVLAISYTSTEVTITWEKSIEDDFQMYRILTSDSEEGERTSLANILDILDTTYTHSEIVMDQKIWYWIEVVDWYGYARTGDGNYIRVSTTLPDIVFTSRMGTDINCLYKTDFDGNNLQQLISDMNVDNLYVPYDGSQIIIEARNIGESGSQIYKIDPSGQNLAQLTSIGNNGKPIISQDGTKIIFNSYRDHNSGELYIMNTDGSDQTRLTFYEDYNGPYDISHDGSKILYMSYASGQRQIHIMNNDGTGDLQLTFTTSGYTYEPRFSPDATTFVYIHRAGSGLNSMNIDGSNQKQLWTQGDAKEAQYSPDGLKILYRGDEELYLMNADQTGGHVRVTNNDNEDLIPQFSDDGQYIVYRTRINDGYEIMWTSSDGSETQQITTQSGDHPFFISK